MKMNALPDKSDNDKSKSRRRTMECYHCHKKGHLKKDCRKLKKEQASGSQEDKKYAVMATSTTGGGQTWFIDSGASYHMTGNLEWIQGYKKLSKPKAICVASSEILYGLGTGSVDVISTVNNERLQVTIQGVMYVPGLSDNLFSQGLADEYGTKFASAQGKISVLCGDKVVMVAKKSKLNNMYVLDIEVPMKACIAREERTQDEWHRVLGHPGMSEIENLNKQGCTVGFKIAEVSASGTGCTGCCQGKAHHVPHPGSQRERATEVLERIHMDLVGQVSPASLGKSQYFLLIRDELSTYLRVYFLRDKTAVHSAVKSYFNEASIQTQRKVKVIRSDNGTEFKNQYMTQICQEEGVVQEFSSTYTPQQNGEIERANRTIIESARALLQASGLPINLWGEAVLTAVYLRNRLTNKRTKEKTPFEIFHGKQPIYSHLVEFGEEAHILENRDRSKFQAKTREVFVVGYGDRINTYRCYDPVKKDILVTSDLYLAPHTQPTRRTDQSSIQEVLTIASLSSDHTQLPDAPCVHMENADEVQPSAPPEQATCDQTDQVEPEDHAAPPPTPPRTTSIAAPVLERDDRRHTAASTSTVTQQSSNLGAQTRPQPRATGATVGQRPHVVPERVFTPVTPQQDAGLRFRRVDLHPTVLQPSGQQIIAPSQGVQMQSTGNQQQPTTTGSATRLVGALSPGNLIRRIGPIITGVPHRNQAKGLSAIVIDYEPKSYAEALIGEDADKWKQAIDEELAAHAKNGTWQIVPKQSHMKEISARWLFKVKDDDSSTGKRYKGRLVARGFNQKAGIDYTDVFAPVVRMDSIRLLFSLCAQFKLKYKQYDVTTAFLNGEVKEDLYLEPPEGLEVPAGHTCKLIRSLYGLKQSPRCWNSKFTQMIKQFGMKATYSDPCVFVNDAESPIYLALYVDDMLIFAKHESDIDKLVHYLDKHFVVKCVNSSCFLGLEITRKDDGSIFLHQKRYVERVLEKFNMSDSKFKATPLETGHILTAHSTLNEPIVKDIPYAESVGSLLYCAVATRPDISYAMSVLSKYSSKPREQHWQAIKRVFRYLRGTLDYGLAFKHVQDPGLICFTDADYAGDKSNRKSTSGMVTFFASGPISYRAQQQSVVALSTTEAEYVAASLAVRDLIWLQKFITELKVKQMKTTHLLCDNQSALRLIKNPEFHQRSKHIDIVYHFIRDKYEEGCFAVEYICSEDNSADVFTKALAKDLFEYHRKAIGCVAMSDS